MTEDKAAKRVIRARMSKTGERYTTARANVTKARRLPPRVADPGISDASVTEHTGQGWDHWFRVLDAWGATERRHGEIARYLSEEHGVADWWTQGVTVGYERARGMRAVNQRADGSFCAYASKTVAVDVDRLSAAFTEARRRNRWLEPGTLRVRTSHPGRSARFDVRDGSRVSAWFEAKGPGKATVSLEVDRLDGASEVARARAFWRERLGRLAGALR